MKIFKLLLLLSFFFSGNVFAGDDDNCQTYIDNIEKEIQNINKQKRLCETFKDKKRRACYLNLSMKHNALSRAIFYTETTCSSETALIIKNLKKGLI